MGDTEQVVPGWVKACGAANLRTGEQTPPPAPELEESFDLISYEGNNGWARGFGADHAIREYTRRRWRHRKSIHGHHTHRAIQDFSARWGVSPV